MLVVTLSSMYVFVYRSNGIEYTIWDRWEVHGNKDFTIKRFIQTLQVSHIANLLVNSCWLSTSC